MIRTLHAFARMHRQPRIGSLILALTLASLPLSAGTIYNNFSSTPPGYDPSTGDSWATGGSGDSGNAVGFQNTLSSSYSLTQIQVADNFFANSGTGGVYDDLQVGLWQSSTNDLNSATELESWAVSPTGSAPVPPSVITLTSSSNPTIDTTDYYFVTETVLTDPSGTNAEWGWQWNNQTPVQTGYYSEFAGAPWFAETGATPVLSVSGNAITTSATPEPRSYTLFLAGILGAFLIRRRRSAHV